MPDTRQCPELLSQRDGVWEDALAFLELADLTMRYGALTVVDRVNLNVEKGELVCLLGPSGCGKTTTLRLIAGFITPKGGEIHVGGRTISSAGWSEPPERRNMSMIFQSYALWPHMTVRENIGYGLMLRKMPQAEIAAARRQNPRRHQAEAACRALSRRAVRRPAAARLAGPRAGRRARDPAARRAALQSRRQSARGDALRDPPPARQVPLHHRLCDA
jgi:ABC-type branched-subunit amino acid transport system ATPase component